MKLRVVKEERMSWFLYYEENLIEYWESRKDL